MGVKDKLRELFAEAIKKDVETDFVSETGGQYGWNVATGRQLEMRQGAQLILGSLVQKELEGTTAPQRLRSLLNKMEAINILMRTSIISWGRAGDDEDYRRRVRAYEGLYIKTLRDVNLMLQDLEGRGPAEQGNITRHCERFAYIVYIQAALYLADITFKDRDITPTGDKTWVFPPSPLGLGAKKTQDTDLAGMKMLAETIQELRDRIDKMEGKR